MTTPISNPGYETLNKQVLADFSTAKPSRTEAGKRSPVSCELDFRTPERLAGVPSELLSQIVKNCHESEGNPKSILAFGCTNTTNRAVVNSYANSVFSRMYTRENILIRRQYIPTGTLFAMREKMKFPLREGYDQPSPDILLDKSAALSHLGNGEKLILPRSSEIQSQLLPKEANIKTMLRDFVSKRIIPNSETLKKCNFTKEQSEKVIDYLCNNDILAAFIEDESTSTARLVDLMLSEIIDMLVTGDKSTLI